MSPLKDSAHDRGGKTGSGRFRDGPCSTDEDPEPENLPGFRDTGKSPDRRDWTCEPRTGADAVVGPGARMRAQRQPVLTCYQAAWSGSCRLLLPVLSELSQSYAGRLVVELVDVSTSPGRARAVGAGVSRIPTCVVSGSDATERARMVGAHPKAELRRLVDAALTME